MRRRGRAGPAAWLVLLGAGCGAAPEWREMQPAGLHLTFSLPCRPDAATRRLLLAGAEVELSLWACGIGGATFALASGDLGDPTRVGAVLAELGAAARANIGGHIERDDAAAVAGMTPLAGARRWRLAGQLSDGSAVAEEVAVFAYGTRVYQATVVGARPDPAVVATFFAGLRVAP